MLIAEIMQFTEYIKLRKAQALHKISPRLSDLRVDVTKNVKSAKRKDKGYLIIFGQNGTPTRRDKNNYNIKKLFAKLTRRSSAEIHAFLTCFSSAQSNPLGPTLPQHQLL